VGGFSPSAGGIYGVGHLLHAALKALGRGKGRFVQFPPDYGGDNGQHGYQAEQKQGQYLQAVPPAFEALAVSGGARTLHIDFVRQSFTLHIVFQPADIFSFIETCFLRAAAAGDMPAAAVIMALP
jgi:hypothetical protein